MFQLEAAFFCMENREVMECHIREDGYLKFSIDEQSKLENLTFEIKNILKELKLEENNYHVTQLSENESYKNKIDNLLKPFFEQIANTILPSYKVLLTNLIIKPPFSGEVPLHQNWTFVDESKYRSYTIWLPLAETNSINGTLEFIIGSHNLFYDEKRGHNTPYFFLKEEARLKKYLKKVTVLKGEVLIFDDAILHYSAQNNSPLDRIAVQAIIVPKEVELLHYNYKKTFFSAQLQEYYINRDFYKTMNFDNYKYKTPSKYKQRKISQNEWIEIEKYSKNN